MDIKPWVCLITVWGLASCGSDTDSSNFKIWSSEFSPGGALPSSSTCEGQPFGEGVSPELNWSGAPTEAKSFALVFKDLSLVDSTTPDYAYHWVMWNIPTTVTSLPAVLSDGQFVAEAGGAEQLNGGSDPESFGYFGPCPSWMTSCDDTVPRTTDIYSFTLYALADETLTLPDDNPDIDNYVREIDLWLETVAIAKTDIQGTSDAVPSEFPACANLLGE